jgi:TolA-binding protein
VAATKIDDVQTARLWLTQLRQKYPENHLVDEAFLLQLKLTQKAGDDQGVIKLAEQFQTQCADSPHAAQVAEMAGRSFYAISDFDNTVLTYQTLLQQSTVDVQAETMTAAVRARRSQWLYLQSLGYLGMKQYDEAMKELKLAEAYNEDSELATLIDLAFATAYFGSQQYSQAVPRYHNFLTHHQSEQDNSSDSPEFVRAACEMTICFTELQQWEDARQAFEIMKTRADDKLVMQTTQYLAEQAYDAQQKELAGEFYEFMAQPGNEQPIVSRGLSGLAWVNMESDDAAATQVYERLIAEYPDRRFSAKATMARARFLEDKNDTAGANQIYAMVIDRFAARPIANEARLRFAHALHQTRGKQELATAQTLLKDYLQSSSEKRAADEALYMLGWVMHDQGKTKQGIVRFQRLVDQHPTSKYWSDAAFRIAQQHLREGKPAEAEALIDKIIAQSDAQSNVPQKVIARARYQKAQQAVAKKDWKQVSSLMQQVIESDDRELRPRAKYWLAESFYQQQMFNEASQRFAAITDLSAIERKLQPWVRLRMAQCLGKLERWDDAGVVANDALHQFGDFANDYEFTFVSARSKEARGLFDDAEKLYTEVIESANGKDSETAAIAQWRIGEMLFHKEQYEDAIEAYYRVDSLYDHAKWRSAAILQAGKCQEHLGNWKHAVKLYSQILDKYPDSKLAESAQERLQLVTRLAEKPAQEKRR